MVNMDIPKVIRHFNPKRQKIDIERVERELALLERQELSYEDLMKGYNKGLIMWAKRHLKDSNSQDRVRRIKREALKISIRKLAVNGAVFNRQVSRSFTYLSAAATEIYEKKDGKNALQRLAEDAGLVYFQKHKYNRSLKQILEETAAFQRDCGTKWRKNSLARIWGQKFGFSGKGIILAGWDYLSMRANGGFKKSDLAFSSEELDSIVKDDSLTEEEKARCLFNALSFQYYEFPEGCCVTKEANGTYYPDSAERKFYLNERLEIAIADGTLENDYIVGIYFSGNSKFRATNFEFSGENSSEFASRFYAGLESRLGFLKGH